jgi:hypothetical protein
MGGELAVSRDEIRFLDEEEEEFKESDPREDTPK